MESSHVNDIFVEYCKNKSSVVVNIIPSSPKNEICLYDQERDRFKIKIKAVPEQDKANITLIKFISKILGKRVEIISGKKSRKKVLKW